MIVSVVAIAIIVVSAFVVLEHDALFGNNAEPETVYSQVVFMVEGTNADNQSFSGNITIALRTDRPETTKNFVNLVNSGFYDDTTFHRIVEGFMIQGGQNASSSAAKIPDEADLGDNHNYNGTIAMANTGDADSASSQFFINVDDNNERYSTFDTSYTVFGTITDGMDLVMEMSHVPCTENPNITGEMSIPVNPPVLVKAIALP